MSLLRGEREILDVDRRSGRGSDSCRVRGQRRVLRRLESPLRYSLRDEEHAGEGDGRASQHVRDNHSPFGEVAPHSRQASFISPAHGTAISGGLIPSLAKHTEEQHLHHLLMTEIDSPCIP